MRFVLDEDVDARLRPGLQEAGHECWTIGESGLAGEADPNVAVYAQKHGAALVTNDSAFSQRVKRKVYGQHVHLNCSDLQGREIFLHHLDTIVALLERHEHLYLSVSRERVEIIFANQGWD